jgi:hypothetical protein
LKLLSNRYNEEEIGNLSPIGNPFMKDEAEDNFDIGYFSPTGRGSSLNKPTI